MMLFLKTKQANATGEIPIRRPSRSIIFVFVLALGLCTGNAAAQICPARPVPGSTVEDPPALYTTNGMLKADLTMSNFLQSGFVMYCYAYPAGNVEAPTLRLNPSDQLVLVLTNQIQQFFEQSPQHLHQMTLPLSPDPDCAGYMTSYSTNVHFHGLNVPPRCHQDETIFTLINPGDPPFRYQINIPVNEPPGLYWYHPHPHGMTQAQIMGGASGALIVEGIDKVKPEVAGLTERVLVLRDQTSPNGGFMTTINFVPAASPYPVIQTGPAEKQFWRVLNAEGETFVRLQVQVNGQAQQVQIVALDGTPLKTDIVTNEVDLPPAGRAEFIMQGPAQGATGTLSTLGVNVGPDGNPNPPQLIANIVPTAAAKPNSKPANKAAQPLASRFAGLDNLKPTAQRSLYFSEYVSSDPGDSKFYITVKGQTPKQFDPSDPPAIVTRQGAVEDWTIENHAHEIHAFHIHQIHFLLVARNGVKAAGSKILDTVPIPAWSGSGPYPSVTIRMDFRDPETVGTSVYHCHILVHEDQGMMAKILVQPPGVGVQH
jgi:FtsP/CotA-like multicopper oxidase with cupredoxin domain